MNTLQRFVNLFSRHLLHADETELRYVFNSPDLARIYERNFLGAIMRFHLPLVVKNETWITKSIPDRHELAVYLVKEEEFICDEAIKGWWERAISEE